MDKLPEWLTAVGTLATAGGVLFLKKQLDLLWKQLGVMAGQLDVMAKQLDVMGKQLQLTGIEIKADHERSARENSINYLFEWSKGLLRSSSLARRLAEKLDEGQTLALAHEEELRIAKIHKELVLGILSSPPRTGLAEEGNYIVLDKSQVADIRWQLVRYLNVLESIFVAARHKVANKEILLEEFRFLYNKEKGHYVLKKFRDAMGDKGYPALAELERELIHEQEIHKGLDEIPKGLP